MRSMISGNLRCVFCVREAPASGHSKFLPKYQPFFRTETVVASIADSREYLTQDASPIPRCVSQDGTNVFRFLAMSDFPINYVHPLLLALSLERKVRSTVSWCANLEKSGNPLAECAWVLRDVQQLQ